MSRVIVFEVDRGNGPERVSFRSAVPVTIGRGPTNQLVIADGRISTRHGEVRFRDGAFHYRDLRSTNGSMRARGDERVVVDGDSTAEVPLEGGDRLLLGDVDDPIVLRVSITVEEVAPEGTIVARRKVDSATELSDVLLQTRGAGFAALSALLRRIGGETEAAEVFEHVAGFLLDLLPAAQSVVLVLRDPTAPALRLTRAERTVTEVAEDPPPWPRGLVSEAMETSEAVLSNELGGDAEQSLARFGAGGALAVPLVGTNAPKLGVLVIASEEAGFAPRDLDLSLALSHQVANAFATARLVRRLRAVERRLRDENRYLKAEVRRNDVFQDIIGDSPAIRAVFEQMRLVMDTDVTVLIRGQTGTGKELVARALHDKSKRRSRLFAAVNCAALTESLLESELFGHVKGAFTGAHDNKKGLFAVADGGTLFLDEIGELSPKLQAKLLRVLQEGEVLPVGSTRPVKVDVRVVAATHRDLQKMSREGGFRQDLYYRINVFPIELPPLRDRGDDVPALAQFFLERYAKRFGKRVAGLSESCVKALKAFPFPGNIRQLENEMQRAVLLTPDGEAVDVRVLSDEVRGATTPMDVPGSGGGGQSLKVAPGATLKGTMERLEREVLRLALEEQGWNRSATARRLEISRQALMVKLSRYDLTPD